MDTVNLLKWRSLSRAFDEMKNPASFLRNKFFTRTVLSPTNVFELSYWLRGRKMAPFVRRGSRAIQVEGLQQNFQLAQHAHIRIKRPMTPQVLLDNRRPGSPIFVDTATIATANANYVAKEARILDDDMSNTEEWMIAQALRGVITYSVGGEDENFTVTIPRSSTHNIILTGTDLWTNAASKPQRQFLQTQKLTNKDVGLNTRICILGKDATTAFTENADVVAKLDNRRIMSPAELKLQNELQDDGALFLGTFYNNVDVWSYDRTITMPDGTEADLIRPDYAEFICPQPANEWYMSYGPIEDLDAFNSSTPVPMRRFGKSWRTPDPSAQWMLAETNPMPIPARPDASCSVKVV